MAEFRLSMLHLFVYPTASYLPLSGSTLGFCLPKQTKEREKARLLGEQPRRR